MGEIIDIRGCTCGLRELASDVGGPSATNDDQGGRMPAGSETGCRSTGCGPVRLNSTGMSNGWDASSWSDGYAPAAGRLSRNSANGSSKQVGNHG